MVSHLADQPVDLIADVSLVRRFVPLLDRREGRSLLAHAADAKCFLVVLRKDGSGVGTPGGGEVGE